MGLDICCKCGEIDFRAGSYSGFMRWRIILSELVGVDLRELWTNNSIKKREGDEPFYELLNHSDCDGTLPYKECKRLLPDFDKLEKELFKPKSLEDIWKKIFGKLDVEKWWIERFELWHKAVRHAVNKECDLLFC